LYTVVFVEIACVSVANSWGCFKSCHTHRVWSKNW
jgi:hypothetical protein